jgi:hypothetical protein
MYYITNNEYESDTVGYSVGFDCGDFHVSAEDGAL